jgi:hypothetical protein
VRIRVKVEVGIAFFQLVFYVEIALRFAPDNLDVKKVLAPSENPAKWLIMCFSRIKNIKSLTFKNSGIH